MQAPGWLRLAGFSLGLRLDLGWLSFTTILFGFGLTSAWFRLDFGWIWLGLGWIRLDFGLDFALSLAFY